MQKKLFLDNYDKHTFTNMFRNFKDLQILSVELGMYIA